MHGHARDGQNNLDTAAGIGGDPDIMLDTIDIAIGRGGAAGTGAGPGGNGSGLTADTVAGTGGTPSSNAGSGGGGGSAGRILLFTPALEDLSMFEAPTPLHNQ